MEQLVTNAKSLAAQGVKELILIAQDLTYYGLDIYKKRNLAELVARSAMWKGIDWIRLHYAFPAASHGGPGCDARAEQRVQLPGHALQHGSTRMLTRMRRGITQEKTEALVATIREKVPGIAIRTTLIAGFPGETRPTMMTACAGSSACASTGWAASPTATRRIPTPIPWPTMCLPR
jgi:ribosomal protein S12 methylthiotransferase